MQSKKCHSRSPRLVHTCVLAEEVMRHSGKHVHVCAFLNHAIGIKFKKRKYVFQQKKSNFEILTFLHFVFALSNKCMVYDLQHIYILHSIQSSFQMNVHKSLPPITVKTDSLNHMALLYF